MAERAQGWGVVLARVAVLCWLAVASALAVAASAVLAVLAVPRRVGPRWRKAGHSVLYRRADVDRWLDSST